MLVAPPFLFRGRCHRVDAGEDRLWRFVELAHRRFSLYSENMDNKKRDIIVYLSVALIVIVVVAAGYFAGWFGSAPATGGNSGGQTSATRSAVPANMVVPGAGATGTPQGVAVPQISIPAAPGVQAQLRVFNISAEKGVFTPSTVIANEGDTVRINFTAVDKTYDMTVPDLNLRQTAQKGETKILEFGANPSGKFTYYCESCGGLNSSATGFIVVVPGTSAASSAAK